MDIEHVRIFPDGTSEIILNISEDDLAAITEANRVLGQLN